ncbi:hypothetical protein DSUL_160097 [Desulfovibrionales bacterium]
MACAICFFLLQLGSLLTAIFIVKMGLTLELLVRKKVLELFVSDQLVPWRLEFSAQNYLLWTWTSVFLLPRRT